MANEPSEMNGETSVELDPEERARRESASTIDTQPPAGESLIGWIHRRREEGASKLGEIRMRREALLDEVRQLTEAEAELTGRPIVGVLDTTRDDVVHERRLVAPVGRRAGMTRLPPVADALRKAGHSHLDVALRGPKGDRARRVAKTARRSIDGMTARPEKISNTGRVLTYIEAHPKVGNAEIAKALGFKKNNAVALITSRLKRTKKLAKHVAADGATGWTVK